MPIFGNPHVRSPSAKLREINRRWKNGEFINGLDPNFGYETKGPASTGMVGMIRGSLFTITEDGTADSITAYVEPQYEGYPRDVKYAIYLHFDLSLVGYTEETAVSSGGWVPLNIVSGGSLSADTEYILAAWAGGTGDYDMYIYYTTGTIIQGHYDAHTYNSFPDPMVPTHNDDKYSIYCTYTKVAPPPVGVFPTRSLRGRGGDARRRLAFKRHLKQKRA